MYRTSLVYVLLTSILVAGACTDDNNTLAYPPDMMDMSQDIRRDCCTGVEDMKPMTDPALDEQGPYDVGYIEATATYTDVLGAERTIPIKVWYPAVAPDDAQPLTYKISGIIDLESAVAFDAPPIAADGPFPTVIYSHGSGGEGLLAYPYAELFASQGWIIASPNHVGNTALDSDNNTATNAVRRVTDIAATLDALEAASADDGLDALSGAADTERTFMFGHSFGAYTTLAIGGADLDYETFEQEQCAEDETAETCEYVRRTEVKDFIEAGFGDARVKAIAPQAPALIPMLAEGTLGDLEVPTMLQSARRDQTTTQEVQSTPAWMGLNGPDDIWVEVPEGGHFTFITICDDLSPALLGALRPDAGEDGCNDTFIPTAEAVPVLRAYLIAYARLHILGEQRFEAMLQGPALDPRFVTTTRD